MTEIGSEFWTADTLAGDIAFFLSGRTALEYIIRDILQVRRISTVHMPSYCCHTMVEPFLRHGLKVRFYDVFHEGGGLRICCPRSKENDIFFHMAYFGYGEQPVWDVDAVRESGCTVVSDRTHSWLMDGDDPLPDFVHYSFVSYRKWTGLTGIASAYKRDGEFLVPRGDRRNLAYEAMRSEAREKKRGFLEKGEGNKEEFLRLFGEAESLLEADYLDFQPSPDSLCRLFCLDRRRMAQQRRANAQTILAGIASLRWITPMFSRVSPTDAPLCVPILVSPVQRDALRRYLIGQKIYCPIHWPLSPMHDGISSRGEELYRLELSLVCDQRYREQDMERLVCCLAEFCVE